MAAETLSRPNNDPTTPISTILLLTMDALDRDISVTAGDFVKLTVNKAEVGVESTKEDMDEDDTFPKMAVYYRYPNTFVTMNDPSKDDDVEDVSTVFLGLAQNIEECDNPAVEHIPDFVTKGSPAASNRLQKDRVHKKRFSSKTGLNLNICMYCAKHPCLLQRNSNQMNEAYGKLQSQTRGYLSNEESRYAMYSAAAKGIYGKLGAGNRRGLPRCVTQYVHDRHPEDDRTDYVGYREDGTVGYVGDANGDGLRFPDTK